MRYNEITEQTFKPKLGMIYRAVGSPDFQDVDLGIIGFRKNQVKVLLFDTNDVDNFDLTGPFALKFDRASERQPSKTEQMRINKAIEYISNL